MSYHVLYDLYKTTTSWASQMEGRKPTQCQKWYPERGVLRSKCFLKGTVWFSASNSTIGQFLQSLAPLLWEEDLARAFASLILAIQISQWTSVSFCQIGVSGSPSECHEIKRIEKDMVFHMFFVYHFSSYETLPKQSGQDWVPGVNPQSSGLRHPIVVLMINCRHGLAGEKHMKTKKETLWGNKNPIGSMGRLYIYLPLVDFDGKCM